MGASEAAWRRLRSRRVAMVFQEPLAALNPLRRVGDTVMEPLRLHLGLTRAAARDRALELFAETGIPAPEEKLRQYPHELSGGQRQRVLIGLALSCDPEVLIADEPTTALDAHVALRITDLLVRLSERRNMTLVYISHDLRAIARATERIAVMYGGEVVEQGPSAAVLGAPAHPYSAGLLAALPTLTPNAARRRLPIIPGAVPALAAMPPGCRFAGRCAEELPCCATQRPDAMIVGPGHAAACHRRAEGPA